MSKPVARFLGLFSTLALALALCACGGGVKPEEGITFKNDLDADIQAIYITSTEVDVWGEPVHDEAIGAKKSVVLEASVLPADVTDFSYDVAVLDENNTLYEFYLVPIEVGNTLTVFVGTESPCLVVTDQYGNDTAIDGESFTVEE